MPLTNWQFLGLIAAAVVLVWAGLWGWAVGRSQPAPQRRSPLTPWQKLCAVHELPDADVQRLQQLCRLAGLREPLLLFVDPRFLEAATDGPEGGEYARIGQQLFGDAFQPR